MAQYTGAVPAPAGGDGHAAPTGYADHGHGHDDHGHGEFHIHHPPIRVYWITFALLMILLLITVGAYFVDVNPVFNIIFAMIIAITKATLVVLYFMNVKGSTRLTWLWAGLGFIWLMLLAGVFLDYVTRPGIPGWQ